MELVLDMKKRCSTDILSLTRQVERESVSFYRYAVPFCSLRASPNGTGGC